MAEERVYPLPLPNSAEIVYTFSMKSRKNLVLGAVCSAIATGILVAGLWPFDFHPANGVEWLSSGNGVRFYGQGIIYSPEPLQRGETASGNASFTLEFLIRPDREPYDTDASILTVYNHYQDQFTVRQWGRTLVLQIWTADADSRGRYYKIGIPGALEREKTRLITLTTGEHSDILYIDGRLAKKFPLSFRALADQALSGYLILGNSSDGIHPWNGSFFVLAMYDRALTGKEVLDNSDSWQRLGQPRFAEGAKPAVLYLFDEHGGGWILNHSGGRDHLRIPAAFQPLRRMFLQVPDKDHWFRLSNMMDITINILGFIPLGFFLAAWLRQTKLHRLTAYRIAVLLGFSLSLAIELAQVYLPGRDSSLLDVFSNTVGTALGILLLNSAHSVFPKHQ